MIGRGLMQQLSAQLEGRQGSEQTLMPELTLMQTVDLLLAFTLVCAHDVCTPHDAHDVCTPHDAHDACAAGVGEGGEGEEGGGEGGRGGGERGGGECDSAVVCALVEGALGACAWQVIYIYIYIHVCVCISRYSNAIQVVLVY